MRKLLLILLLLVFSTAHAQDESRFPSRYFAPYIARYPAVPMAVMADEIGVRYFTLAFILNGGDCSARWGGSAPLNMPFLHTDLEKLREMGGDVIVSFGGANGAELAEACTDLDRLIEQYQAVIDEYEFTHLDFDIEGARTKDQEEVDRRSEAIAALQAANEGLIISYTLSVGLNGLSDDSLNVLQSAIDHGVQVDVVNIMTMNFGKDAAPDRMGDNTIQAANSLFDQLETLYPDKTEDELWNMIGLTPMIGLNDVSTQVFTLEDAQQVADFAVEKNIRLLAFWSIDRDQECVSGVRVVSPKCSGLRQDAYAFAKTFNTLTTELD